MIDVNSFGSLGGRLDFLAAQIKRQDELYHMAALVDDQAAMRRAINSRQLAQIEWHRRRKELIALYSKTI